MRFSISHSTRKRPKGENLDLYFEEIIRLLNIIKTDGSGPLHSALEEVLLRLLEMGILHDKVVLRIGTHWQSLGATARPHLTKRLSELLNIDSSSIPFDLIDHITKVISGSAFQRGRRQVDYNDYFLDVLERTFRKNGSKRLSCANCGYHFLPADLGSERRAWALDAGAILAEHYHSNRKSNIDPWKPLSVKSGQDSRINHLTRLTLDHLIPEEGLGWSDSDNLEITCQLCNQGKLIYRHPLEAISVFAAGGLSDFPKDRGWTTLKQMVISFCFEYYDRQCWNCKSKSTEVELTARPRKVAGLLKERSESFGPWNMVTLCYKCSQKY